MTAQTRWILRHPLRYAALHLKPWLPRLRVDWECDVGGFTWFNVSAPCVSFSLGWHRVFSLRLWEAFNRECADGEHYWGFVVLNINGRALMSMTHDGARGLFL